MKVVALIPIKLESKRLPYKNLKKFYDEKPLIWFIQNICLESRLIDEIYIYSSSELIKDYLMEGVKFLKRPDYLDGDDKNANDIISEFIKVVDADIYVNTHTTSPFAKVESINTCIEKVMSGKYDSAFCAERIRTFLWHEDKPINFDLNKLSRTQDLPAVYSETSIAYVFSKDIFKKYNRRVGVNPYIHEVGKIEAIDIDYLEDFEMANAVYKEVIINGNKNR